VKELLCYFINFVRLFRQQPNKNKQPEQPTLKSKEGTNFNPLSEHQSNRTMKTYGQDEAKNGWLHQVYVVIAAVHQPPSLCAGRR